jgi:hypothetical protein
MSFIANSMVAEMHKTFMQDVMDKQGQVLFDNLAWFAKKMCSVMTGASACGGYTTSAGTDWRNQI